MEVQGSKICMQDLTKEWKQPPAVVLQKTNFYNVFILWLWLIIIKKLQIMKSSRRNLGAPNYRGCYNA